MAREVYAYYPGCTLKTTGKEFDISARLVCDKLGIELQELEDWVCCGASSAHSTSHLLALALPAQELQSAEAKGLPLAVACAMCFSRLKYTAHALKDKALSSQISQALGKSVSNKVAVKHLLEILDPQSRTFPVKKQLSGLKVACYYGCLLVRPKEITEFDDEENPQKMDRLISALGAEAIPWEFKTECCGASLLFAHPEAVLKLSHRILFQAKQAGSDVVAVACPMCQSNLDAHQKEMRREFPDFTEIPVLYFTQLMGLSFGFSPGQLLLDKHFVNPLPLLSQKGLA